MLGEGVVGDGVVRCRGFVGASGVGGRGGCGGGRVGGGSGRVTGGDGFGESHGSEKGDTGVESGGGVEGGDGVGGGDGGGGEGGGGGGEA